MPISFLSLLRWSFYCHFGNRELITVFFPFLWCYQGPIVKLRTAYHFLAVFKMGRFFEYRIPTGQRFCLISGKCKNIYLHMYSMYWTSDIRSQRGYSLYIEGHTLRTTKVLRQIGCSARHFRRYVASPAPSPDRDKTIEFKEYRPRIIFQKLELKTFFFK